MGLSRLVFFANVSFCPVVLLPLRRTGCRRGKKTVSPVPSNRPAAVRGGGEQVLRARSSGVARIFARLLRASPSVHRADEAGRSTRKSRVGTLRLTRNQAGYGGVMPRGACEEDPCGIDEYEYPLARHTRVCTDARLALPWRVGWMLAGHIDFSDCGLFAPFLLRMFRRTGRMDAVTFMDQVREMRGIICPCPRAV